MSASVSLPQVEPVRPARRGRSLRLVAPAEVGDAADRPETRSVGNRSRDPLTHEVLGAEAEVDLAVRIETGLYATHLLATGADTSASVEELEWLAADGEFARQTFIESNLRLAVSIARKFRGRGMSDEDVEQDAYQGLVKAVERFDYAKGFKFSTYAVWWIRESIQTGIRQAQAVKYPEARHLQITKVIAIQHRLFNESGSVPDVATIAAAAGMTPSEVERALREHVAFTSLDVPIGDDLTLGEVICDDAAGDDLAWVEDRLDLDNLRGRLEDALGCLPEDAARVLRARFGFDGGPPRSVMTVAKEFGWTRQTVRYREQRGLQMLRHPRTRVALTEFRETL